MNSYPKNTQQLEWDSVFFGYDVYKVDGWLQQENLISTILQELDNKGATLVYWYAKEETKFPSSYHTLLADIKIDYSKPIGTDIVLDEKIISYPSDKYSEKLISLALASGKYSRFKTDPEFKNGEFEKLYWEWLLKSIKRENADDILIYQEQDSILGFVTFSLNPLTNIARIGLIAVDEEHRGKKIGKKLLDAVLHKANAKGCKYLHVSTQEANKQACNFYEKWGFAIAERTFIYHIWYPNSK